MTTDHKTPDLHCRQVEAVTRAAAKLLPNLAQLDFTPEAIFEGLIKGAAVQIMAARNCSASDVSDLLADMAAAFGEAGDVDSEPGRAVN